MKSLCSNHSLSNVIKNNQLCDGKRNNCSSTNFDVGFIFKYF